MASTPNTTSPTVTNALLIIGYGSLLRGDDGVGQHVACQIAARGWPHVHSIAATQLTPEMAAEVAVAGKVIFVDACPDATASASISWQSVDAEPFDTLSLSHQCTPQSLMWLAKALYGQCPQAWLLAIPGSDFSLNDLLSPQAMAGAEIAADLIGHMLEIHHTENPLHA